jgi:hypothetical protein
MNQETIPIRIRDAALEERGDFIILRGVIDPQSLKYLLTPDYQRGTLTRKVINSLANAIKTSKVPDVELAVRGGDFTERTGIYTINSPTYIMDGLQRISAARQVLEDNIEPFLGATAYFNTTIPWERERFRILNADRVRVSPNVLLRNQRGDNQALKLIYDMTTREKSFLLYERVTWQQNQKRTEVMTALVMLRTIRALHAHVPGIGGNMGSSWIETARALKRVMDTISRSIFISNINTYFSVLDQCWSIRNVVFTERQAHLKGTFLLALAAVLSRYENFWNGEKLSIDRLLVKKISLFPINDPEVRNLAGASGQSRNILTAMLADHINSGKRTQRLRPRTREEIANAA